MDDNNNKGLSKEEILRRKLQYELERMYYNIEVASESNGATKDVHNPRDSFESAKLTTGEFNEP